MAIYHINSEQLCGFYTDVYTSSENDAAGLHNVFPSDGLHIFISTLDYLDHFYFLRYHFSHLKKFTYFFYRKRCSNKDNDFARIEDMYTRTLIGNFMKHSWLGVNVTSKYMYNMYSCV